LIFIPKVYFEKNLFNINASDNISSKSSKSSKISKKKDNKINEDDFMTKKHEVNSNKADLDTSVFEYKLKEGPKINKCKEFCMNLKLLVRNTVFMVSTSAVVVLLFIVTAIQFWISDYLKIVLKIDESIIIIAFVVTCVTAPTLGIILGGLLVQKYGGYEKKIASLWCVVFAILASICSIFIPIFSSITGFAIVLWLFFFFGGAIMPNIIGIYISSLPPELRGAGNSISNTFINAFGYLPAPYVYGALFDATHEHNPRISLAVVINYSWVGVILLALSMFFRYRAFNKQEETDILEKENMSISKGIGFDIEKDSNSIKIQFSEVSVKLIFRIETQMMTQILTMSLK
jgi:MFS family permease